MDEDEKEAAKNKARKLKVKDEEEDDEPVKKTSKAPKGAASKRPRK